MYLMCKAAELILLLDHLRLLLPILTMLTFITLTYVFAFKMALSPFESIYLLENRGQPNPIKDDI